MAPIPWTTIFGAVGLVGLAGSGGWAVFQTQLGSLQHQIDSLRATSEKNDSQLRRELERRETEINNRLDKIEGELLARRSEFVGQAQFGEFKNSVDRYMSLPYLTSKEFDAWRMGQGKVDEQIYLRLHQLEQKTIK